MRCTIFQDDTAAMPSEGQTEIATPVKIGQMTKSPSGALVKMGTTSQMDVVNVSRPRRGHDY